MITNRVPAKPVRRERATALPEKFGANRVRSRWSRLVLIAAATIATGVPSASLARRQNSSAAGLQADRHEELVRASKADEDVNVATFYMHKGDYGAAIPRLEEAVKLDPRDPKAQLLLAESYEKQGDRDSALKAYQTFVASFPNSRDDKKVRKKIAELEHKRD